MESRCGTVEDFADIPFSFRGEGFFSDIRPMQSVEEFRSLYRAVARKRPQTVLEIGTFSGGTLYSWCRCAEPDALIISIDLPRGKFGGGYIPQRAPFYRAFRREGQEMVLLRSDSHSTETLKRVREILGAKRVDFLFIDGDHTYTGVKQDFELYLPLVAPGGLVALHDVHPRPKKPKIEVHRFWKELKQVYPQHEEWIDLGGVNRAIGIGLITLPSASPLPTLPEAEDEPHRLDATGLAAPDEA